ncbi:MAG TPA: PHP domain-containing protein [Firmicutes bacterium]|nr:PHP domain-containing protein [Bacillota bacterium]
MIPFADYHTHTRYSHGRGSIEDNVRAARAKGLQEIAITDHGPNHYFIGLKGEKAVKEARRELDSCQEKYSDMKILLGVEANIISPDGEIDVSDTIMPYLDLILVGFHLMVKTTSLSFFYQLNIKNRIARYKPGLNQVLRRQNTAALIKAVQRYPVKIVTHPGFHVDIDTPALAQACRERGTSLEINCSHLKKGKSFIKAALATGVTFAISSDAHSPSQVGEFQEALDFIRQEEIPLERIINVRKN